MATSAYWKLTIELHKEAQPKMKKKFLKGLVGIGMALVLAACAASIIRTKDTVMMGGAAVDSADMMNKTMDALGK